MKKKHSNKLGKFMIFLFLLVITLTGCSSQAVAPENMQYLDFSKTAGSDFLTETHYTKQMDEIVLPYVEQYKTSDYFISEDESALYYEQYLLEDTDKHVVILHGFTESSQRYKEVIYYFLKRGYSVSILDHRSHGYSQRFTEDVNKVHITDFNDFVIDLKVFMDTIVMTSKDTNYLLFAHSMGGAIGSLFIEQYPDYFTAAVLSSPMMEIKTGSYPLFAAHLITNTAVLTGFGESYVFGHGPFDDTIDFNKGATTSKERYKYYMEHVVETPALQLSGASFSWLKASLKATDQLIENAASATLPVLVFQSEYDTLVGRNGHYKFVEKAPHASLIFVEGAKHELFNATNDILVPYFNTIFEFFDRYTRT